MDTSHYDKCRTMMITHKHHHKIRIVSSCILILSNLYLTVMLLPVTYNRPYLYGFAFGVMAILYCIGILAAALFSTPEKPKILLLTCMLLLFGMLVTFVHPFMGIVMLILWLTEIPECRQAAWIQEQEGYPHFNERFTEQMQFFGKDYQPDHPIDNVREAEMPDIPEISDSENTQL